MNKLKKFRSTLLMLFSGIFLLTCNQQNSSTDNDMVKLNWYILGGPGFPYQDGPEVYDELNKMLREDLGVDVEFIVTGKFSEYNEILPLAMAAGEKSDIVWTASWCNSFLTAC